MGDKYNDIRPGMKEFLGPADEPSFVWDNLPDDMTPEELEDMLYCRGQLYGKGWGRQ